GALGFIEPQRITTNRLTSMALVPGFARGLAFHGQYAFVGISKPRHGFSDGLPIHQRVQKSGEPAWCGFHVIDTATGQRVEWFRIEAQTPCEISALELVRDVSAVEAYSSESEVASEFLSWET